MNKPELQLISASGDTTDTHEDASAWATRAAYALSVRADRLISILVAICGVAALGLFAALHNHPPHLLR